MSHSPPATTVQEAARSTAATSNVPAALSSFIGREAEVRRVHAQLAAGRLLTLVGPGGVGKTRLAREVAHREAQRGYFRAVWWMELAPVRDAAELLASMASVLGVGGAPGGPLIDAVIGALDRQPTLLVLDNCEHVVDELAVMVATLLQCSTALTLLATSREALGVDGEMSWAIPVLGVPGAPAGGGAVTHWRADDVATFDAARLFVERVQAVSPGFTLSETNATAIATLCQRLDGMPLSLELAAAVTPTLGVETLASRLDDALGVLSRGKRSADPRHRSLRAVLDWSYALLQPAEQRLLARLAVFRGAFSLDAVDAVCAADAVERRAVLHSFGRLVEQSLVEVRDDGRESRYRLLETVRQYGEEQLRAAPDARDVRARHARFVADLAVHAEDALFSPLRGRTVSRLRESMDEIRAAIEWGLSATGDLPLTVELGGVLGWFWISGVPWAEARATVHRILEAYDARDPREGQRPRQELLAFLRLTYPVAGLAYFAGDPHTMIAITERERVVREVVLRDALSVEERRTVLRQGALSEQLHGIALAMLGDAPRALPCMDRSIALAAQAHDTWLVPVMRIRRALVHYFTGNCQAAADDYLHAIPELRAIGEQWFLSLALEGMANVQVAMGDPASALPYALEAAVVLETERDPWFVSRACDTVAWVIAHPANPQLASDAAGALAARLMGAAESLRQSCGAGIIGPDVQRDSELRARLRARLGDAAFEAAVLQGRAYAVEEALRCVRDELAPFQPPAVTASLPLRDHAARVRVTSRGERRDNVEVTVTLLGPFAVSREGESVAERLLPTGKVRDLLVYLALHERAAKETIGLALWPDATAAQVRNLFHVTLHQLRRLLGESTWIAFEAGFYRLQRTTADGQVLRVDVDTLEACTTAIVRAARQSARPDRAQLDVWEQVLQTHARDLLDGVAADDWLISAQDGLRTRWLEAAEALVQWWRAAEEPGRVMTMCELIVRRDAFRESVHRAYMEALGRVGDTARALSHYESFAALLQRELGAQPSAETRRLVAALRVAP